MASYFTGTIELMNQLTADLGVYTSVLILVIVWSVFWKGLALWRAGRNNHLGWFVAIFLLNTLGIVPIIYLWFFSKKRR